MRTRRPLPVAAVLVLIAFCACSKRNNSRTPSLESYCFLMGYTTASLSDTDAFLCDPGEKSPLTTGAVAFPNNLFTKQAVYTSDFRYLIPGTIGADSGRTMTYILTYDAMKSKLTKTRYTGGNVIYPSISANETDNTYYALSANNVVLLTPTDSFFGDKPVAKPLYAIPTRHSSLVRSANGQDLYFWTTDGNNLYIEQNRIGDSICRVVSSLGNRYRELVGLLFNSRGNQLYAVATEQTTGNNLLLKINPQTGESRVLYVFPVRLNTNYFSSAIKRCYNSYIISAPYLNGTNTFQQFDTSGKLLRLDTTANLFQGMISRTVVMRGP